MRYRKRSASSASEHAAELERIEHAKRIVIEVLDKGILDLREVGYLAIDLSGLDRLVQNGVCPCNMRCGGCDDSCPQPIMPGEFETVIKPGRE